MIWEAAAVEVTKFEPNLGVQNEISPKGGARAGGCGTGSEGCHDAKVISTNVQLEGTTLWREDM